jgi:hypothetical protein
VKEKKIEDARERDSHVREKNPFRAVAVFSDTSPFSESVFLLVDPWDGLP